MSTIQEFFVMIKPDGVKRGLIGEIISRFEKKGFKIKEMKSVSPSREMIVKHYEEYSNKVFFNRLVNTVSSGRIIAIIMEGNIDLARRKVVGKPNPLESESGTIRGDYATSMNENLIHCSDSIQSAKREIELWF